MSNHPATIGKYEILTPVGAGGMARVYLGRQTGLAGFEKIVVIKAIHAHLSTETRFVDMFLDEARIAAQINHPNVAQVYDLGHEDGQYYLVMEYVPGEALNSVIVTGLKQKKPMTPKIAARLVAWAAEGLHAAHELRNMAGEALEVVHRDITPGNIIALYQGGAKVVDFGIAKARGRLTKTETEGLKGKLSYLSPEQLDEETVDRRSDVFALGIVLWELLALKRLFQRRHPAASIKAILQEPIPPPSSVQPGVPRALDDIVLRALERNPKDRYQTAQEMQAALERGRLPGTIVVADYMKSLFAQRIENRQELLKRLATGGRLDSKELAEVAEGFHMDDSGSVSLPSVDLSGLRSQSDGSRRETADPVVVTEETDAITTAETSLDDIDIDVEVAGDSTTQEVPILDEEAPAGSTTLDEKLPSTTQEKVVQPGLEDVPTDATVMAKVPEAVLAIRAQAKAGDAALDELLDAAEEPTPARSRAGKRPWIVLGIASLFLLVVLVLLFVVGPGAQDADTETIEDTTETAVEIPADEIAEPEDTQPTKSDKRPRKRRKKRPPPPPPKKPPPPPKKPSASTLFDTGVDK
jgi:serine/threonine-protein kinase